MLHRGGRGLAPTHVLDACHHQMQIAIHNTACRYNPETWLAVTPRNLDEGGQHVSVLQNFGPDRGPLIHSVGLAPRAASLPDISDNPGLNPKQ